MIIQRNIKRKIDSSFFLCPFSKIQTQNKVDYVITHCAPQDIASYISHGYYKPDILTMYLGEIARELKFTKWYFGHYHSEQAIMGKFILHYDRIERII